MLYEISNSRGRKHAISYSGKNKITNHNSQQLFNERSNVMFKSLFYSLVALLFISGMTFGQNLVIQSTGTFSGNGAYNIKGNITNAGVSSEKTIPGTVTLSGTAAAQSIGTDGNGSLVFDSLKLTGSQNVNLEVTSTVNEKIEIAFSNGSAIFGVNGDTLNIEKLSTRTSGVFDADASGSVVQYRGASAQTAMQGSYNVLNFLNAGAKSLEGDITAVDVTHTGGNLTINNDFTVSNAASFAILEDITSGSVLTFGAGTGSVDSVKVNNGRINGGSGNVTFDGGVNNSGKIVGSSGNMLFAGVLNNNADSVIGGTGGVTFNGAIDNNATIYATSGDSLDFNGDVSNNATGVIALGPNGRASFAGTFTSTAGTIALDATSHWYYDGGNQTVSGGLATYGNLYMTGTNGSTKTVAGNITVQGNFDNGGPANLSIITDFGTDSLKGTTSATRFNENSTVKFGGTNNGLLFTTGTVDYNAASGTQFVDGHATDNYETLVFSGGGTKEISAGVRVGTSAGLTVNSGVTAHILATGQLQVGLTSGNLTNAGVINNEGTVQIGQ